MATNNQVNVVLSGSTGTGNFVGANTPTLITPVLGAATATSINFGGSTLSTFTDNTTWTPTMTFATPGDLTVAYANQLGNYQRIGNIVVLHFVITFTPTYTTASGNMIINGLPFTAAATAGENYFGSAIPSSAITWPVGCTSCISSLTPSTKNINISCSGTATGSTSFSTTQITSTVARTFIGSMTYFV